MVHKATTIKATKIITKVLRVVIASETIDNSVLLRVTSLYKEKIAMSTIMIEQMITPYTHWL